MKKLALGLVMLAGLVGCQQLNSAVSNPDVQKVCAELKTNLPLFIAAVKRNPLNPAQQEMLDLGTTFSAQCASGKVPDAATIALFVTQMIALIAAH